MPARIGMAQILVQGGEPAANLTRAADAVTRAKREGCDIVVLPECLDFGWTDPSARDAAQPIPGRHLDALCAAAHGQRIWLVAGIVERAGDALYNAGVVIDPCGELRHVHRKINELDIARDLYATGDRLGVVPTEHGVIGVNVCADNFPESLCIGRTLARMGVTMILSPCAWAVDGDHDNVAQPYGDLWRGSYTTLAREHGVAVIGVSAVGPLRAGPWAGRKLIGCSLAIGRDGEELAQAPYGEDAEAMVVVEVE